MATDVEESDTEDHERLAPSKRQCIKIINITNEGNGKMVLQQNQDDQTEAENESLVHEKMLRYQEYQIDKHCYMGSVDNTINRVMETYVLTPPLERAQLRLFRETEMEDRAVMMAIHNHGLVHSADNSTQWSENALCFANSANDSTELSSESNDSNSACATTSKIFTSPSFQQFKEVKHNYTTDKQVDDVDEQQDILERAVAEAIKIKGLSALSVDYG